MSKIAFLGPKYLVDPLSPCGIEIAPAETAKEGSEILKKLVAEQYDTIFITERLAIEIKKEIEAIEGVTNVVFLPDHRGSIGLLKEMVESLIKKAAGAVKV